MMDYSFNWIHYLYLNQDLISDGIRTKDQAIQHYNSIGKKEGRIYKYDIPIDFDKIFYSELNPHLKNMPEDILYAHYTIYGKKTNAIYNKKQLVPKFISNNLEIFKNGKNIFFFAPHCPEYDTSSGGYRLLQILKVLKKELNYNVYFFCNASKSQRHLEALNKINIPVYITDIKNEKYTINYAKELSEQGINPDFIFISWLDMAKQVIVFLKENFPDAKIILDSVDIHWLREKRKLEKNNQKETSQFLFNKNLEKSMYKNSNVVLCVTENDKAEIIKEMPDDDINIKIVSNIYPNSFLTDSKKNRANNIIFVGGFSHEPNIDAALWCHEIYQKFIQQTKLKKIPKLYIAGSNPPKEILKLHKNNVIVTGYVDEEELQKLYDDSKISISPLRWGAGIKGKVCEALYKNTCVLTTAIGNEGINLIHGEEGFLAESTEGFVNSLNEIYRLSNKDLLEIKKRAKNKIYNLTSYDSAKVVLKSILEAKPIIICIVTYNQSKLLEKCIESIVSNTTYPNYKIIVIDNASNDNTKEVALSLVNKYSNIIEYRRNKDNEFFIRPNNKVIEEFKDHDIVLVNHDIEILDKCWLTRLYTAAYGAYYIGCAGGKTIYPNGLLAEAGAELYEDGTGRNIGRNENPNQPLYNKQKYVGYVSGCLMYMRRDAIEKIGILDYDLEPMYYEDSEWQYRLHINGLKTIYEPRCVAIHAEGSSAGTDTTKGMKRFQEINRIKFIKKYKKHNIEKFNESNILAHM